MTGSRGRVWAAVTVSVIFVVCRSELYQSGPRTTASAVRSSVRTWNRADYGGYKPRNRHATRRASPRSMAAMSAREAAALGRRKPALSVSHSLRVPAACLIRGERAITKHLYVGRGLVDVTESQASPFWLRHTDRSTAIAAFRSYPAAGRRSRLRPGRWHRRRARLRPTSQARPINEAACAGPTTRS